MPETKKTTKPKSTCGPRPDGRRRTVGHHRGGAGPLPDARARHRARSGPVTRMVHLVWTRKDLKASKDEAGEEG